MKGLVVRDFNVIPCYASGYTVVFQLGISLILNLKIAFLAVLSYTVFAVH